ncbi:MAG: hypothetical protein ACXW4C_02060 [Nitrospira sp.]
MNTRTITNAAGRGTAEVTPIVGLFMALTLGALVGLAITPAWAEVGTRLHKEHSLTHSQKPVEQTSYANLTGAQFFGPPPPETATDDGVRFINTDPHLHDGHRPYHASHHHANIADGGALMFDWAFDK